MPARTESSMPEDQIKAAFLFNFAKFIEWPPEKASGSSLALCVLGRDSFAASLEQTVSGKTVNGKPLEVRRLSRPEDAKPCHVVFIPVTDKNRAQRNLQAIPSTGVLTVGESEDFAERGGIINFIKDENRIRFEINLDAAARAGIRISSRLLQLARVIRDEAAAR